VGLNPKKGAAEVMELLSVPYKPQGRGNIRSHDELTLRGSGAGFNKNIQQNIGDEQAPNGAKFQPALRDNPGGAANCKVGQPIT